MNPVQTDVGRLLAANGQGTLGTDLFSSEWGQVDSQLLVVGTEGTASELPWSIERVSFQLLSRGDRNESQSVAYERIKQAYDFLSDQGSTEDYICYIPASGILALGRDEEQRYIYSVNFTSSRAGTMNQT